MKIPAIYFCTVVLTHTLLAQELEVFRLPNGLEVRARQLANTGIIQARLLFSWTESTDYAPTGTAWMMSKILPVLGNGGMNSAAFQNRKDQFGTLSRMDSGRGWIAWTFESMPSDADMMIELLANESLRPDWAKSETLPGAIASANYDRLFRDVRETAIHTFRSDIGDAAIPQMPEVPIDRRQFVTMWTNVVRRPEKAVLSVAGDLESISFKRLIHQHFGPWEGVRADKADTVPAKAVIPEWPGPVRRFIADIGSPEVWIAWNLYALSQEDAELTMALIPWLLRTALPASDEIINTWQADPDGRWLRAMGQLGVSSEKLESHLKSTLNSITQDLLNRAVKARNDYIRANALHPDRTLRQDTVLTPPTLDELRRIIEKCMTQNNLATLVIGDVNYIVPGALTN